MKSKLLPRRLKGRINSRQLLALLLSLACVVTCTVGAIIGFTFASDDGKLKGASPGADGVSFGDGALRAYLVENPDAAAIFLDSDTLNLVLEITGPAASGGGGGDEGGEEPVNCGCAPAKFCGEGGCAGCPVCKDAEFCGDGKCLGCPTCKAAEFCGDGDCLGCPTCKAAVSCGDDDCPGDCGTCEDAVFCNEDDQRCDFVCGTCEDAVFCNEDDQKCDFVCGTCKDAVFCNEEEQKCDFECKVCEDAVLCDCEDEASCECVGCDCCNTEEGGEEGSEPAETVIGMSDFLLRAELSEHIRDYFDISAVTTTDGAVLTITKDALERDWKYTLQLIRALEEGESLQLVVTLTFDRDAFNASPYTPDVLVDMLENIEASYRPDGEELSVTKDDFYDAPQIAYPAIDEEPGEAPYTAAMSASVTREGTPVAGKFVRAGDVVLYEIVIANNGEEMIPGLLVEAPIPDGTTFIQCVEDDLTSEPGESPLAWLIDLPVGGMTLSFEVSVDELPPETDYREIVAYATVGGTPVDCDSLEQYANELSVGELSATFVSLPGGGPVSAGWPIVYTIALTNEGEEPLTDILVRCNIPDGTTLFSFDPEPVDEPTDELSWVIDSIAPEETVTLTFTVTVQALPSGSTGRNIVATAFLDYDGEEEIGTITHTQSPAQLAIAKRGDIDGADVDGANVSQGDIITYTVSVTNEGGSPAYDIDITDALPGNLDYIAGTATGEGTPADLPCGSTVTCDVTPNGVTDDGVDRYNFHWAINQLQPGDTAEVSFQAQVTALPETLSGRAFDNIASVNGEETNQVSCWQPDESLDAVKSADPPDGAYVRTDETILYTIRMENVSANPKYDVLILDELPEGTQFDDDFGPIVMLDGAALAYESPLPADEAEKSGLFSWDAADGTVQFIIGEIPEGSVAEATFRVKVLAPGEDSTLSTRNIDNTAKVQGKDTNTVRHVQALRDIAARKYADPSDGATVYAYKADGSGTRITYFIEVTNTTGQARDVEIEDTLPEGLVYVPGSMTDEAGIQGVAVTDASGTVFHWLVEGLDPDASVTVQFKADVSQLPGSDARDFVNSALADGYATSDVMHHQYASSLRAAKAADPAPGPVAEDEIITYAIEVENTGDADEFDLPVFDSIPEGTEYVDDSALLSVGSWSTDAVTYDDESLAWVIPQLEAGETALITFQVKVLPLPEGAGRRFISNQAQAGEGGQARMTNTVTHQQGELDLTIEKSADKARVAQGGIVTYTITVTNNGGAAAALPVSDSIPDGMTYVPGSATQDGNIALNETAAKLDWLIASLASGATAEITFQVKADALADGAQSRLVDNIAEVCGASTNPVSVEVYSHLLSAIPPSGDTVQVGDTITYKISLYNAFESDSPALKVVNALPAGTQFVNGSITGIGSGEYILATNHVEWNIEALPFGPTELTFQVTVLPSAADGEIRNKALIYGYGDAAEETNEVFHNVALPDLFAEKSADRPGTEILQPGSTLTYFITVFNNSDAAIEGIPVLDVIPAGTSYVEDSADHDGVYSEEDGNIKWTVDVDAQDSVELSFRVTVDEIESGQVTITNRALYGGPDATIPDIFTGQVTHTAAVEIVEPEPELFAEKIADRPDTAILRPGDTLTYTITVYNNSDEVMAGIPVLDAIPAGTTYVEDSADNDGVYDEDENAILWSVDLAAQGEIVLSFQVTIDDIAIGEVSIKNQAVYGPEDALTNLVAHTAQAEVIVPPSTFRAEKIADRPGTALLRPGDILTYTITVFNETDEAMEDIPVLDAIPAGTTYVAGSADNDGTFDAAAKAVRWTIDVDAQDSVELSFKVTVDDIVSGQVTITNRALYGEPGATIPDIFTNPVTHTAAAEVTPPADLDVAKSADIPSTTILKPGDTLTYTITVENNTDEAMEDIPVLDAIPAGTSYVAGSADHDGAFDAAAKVVRWTIDVDAQDSVALSFKVKVDNIASGQVTITNRALYGEPGATIPDIFTNPVTHTAAAEVTPPADLDVAKSADIPSTTILRPGDILTYTITVENNTDEAMEDIPVLDAIPTGTSYVAGSADHDGAFDAAAKIVRWTIDVDAQDSVELSFKAKVDNIASGQVTITNKALYGEAGAETPGTFTNSVTHTAAAVAAPTPDVKVTKGADVPEGEVKAGQRIVYSLRVENKGDAEAKGIAVRDILPAGVSIVDSPEGSYNAAKRELSWAIPSLEAGKDKTLTFTVTVNVNLSAAPLSVKNKAYYIPGTGLAEKETNEITHVVPTSTIVPPGLVTPGNAGTNVNIGAINIGNGISIGSGNVNSGNVGSNVNSGSSGNSGSSNGGKTTSSIGGKDIPKTSEASALWAIILTLASGAVAAAAMILIRKKKALARKH